MTILLTPDTVKKDTNRQSAEQNARVRDLSLEEERLIRSVNDLRAEETAEKKRLTEEMPAFRAAKAKEKADLQREVDTLENRRRDAMRPINQLKKDAEDLLEIAKQEHKKIDERETKVKADEELLTERLEKADDRDQLQDERDVALDERQRLVADEEARSKTSAAGLATRWAEFHVAVKEANDDIEKRESAVAARERVVEITTAEQKMRGEAQDEKDRELADRSATLERAAAEIRGLKQ